MKTTRLRLPLYPKQTRMKIAVVGLGWLGFPLAKSLVGKGHQVVGSTRTLAKVETLKANGIETILMDATFENSQDLTHFFDKTAVCVLNFPPNRNENTADLKAYGMNALRIAALFPTACKFIFVSSTGIYPDENQLADEASIDRNRLAQHHPLAFAESALDTLLGNRLTIVRMAGLIGEQRKLSVFFSGRENVPNGNAPVNLIHQVDCIRIIEQIISKNCWGETFNACASDHPTREAYYTFACQKDGIALPTFQAESKPTGKVILNQKSKQMLDFEYKFDSPFSM